MVTFDRKCSLYLVFHHHENKLWHWNAKMVICIAKDRLWRKNRAVYPENACDGVDLNRNFDDHFDGPGTSDISCSETYHGKILFKQLHIISLYPNCELISFPFLIINWENKVCLIELFYNFFEEEDLENKIRTIIWFIQAPPLHLNLKLRLHRLPLLKLPPQPQLSTASIPTVNFGCTPTGTQIRNSPLKPLNW